MWVSFICCLCYFVNHHLVLFCLSVCMFACTPVHLSVYCFPLKPSSASALVCWSMTSGGLIQRTWPWLSLTPCFVPLCMLAWPYPMGTYVTLPIVGFFSPQTHRPGRTITSKERAVRCIQKLCPPLSLGWHFHKPASKLPPVGNLDIPPK